MSNDVHNFQEDQSYSSGEGIKDIPFLGKTYLFFGLAVLISGIIGLIAGYFLSVTEGALLYPFLFGGLIAVLITTVVIHINTFKETASLAATLPTLIIYSAGYGFIISPVFVVLSGYVLAIAFGITSLVFGGLALYGTLSKRNFFGFFVFMVALMFGAMLISLLNLIIFHSFEVDYVIELVFFAVFLGYVIIDSNRVMRLQNSGRTANALAVYCALQLFGDFMYIFLRFALLIAQSQKK